MWLEAGVGAELGCSCGSWARVVAGVRRVQPELEARSQLSLAGACGGVRWVRFCESAWGLPANPLVLLLGATCAREACYTLSGSAVQICVYLACLSQYLPSYLGPLAKQEMVLFLLSFHWCIWGSSGQFWLCLFHVNTESCKVGNFTRSESYLPMVLHMCRLIRTAMQDTAVLAPILLQRKYHP